MALTSVYIHTEVSFICLSFQRVTTAAPVVQGRAIISSVADRNFKKKSRNARARPFLVGAVQGGGKVASSKFYSAELSGRMGAAAGGSGGVGAPPAAAAGEAPGTAAGPVEREASPKLTASALQHLQPSLPSPALAAFEARELPEGLPSAKQGGAYWGKVSAVGVGVGWSPGFSVFVCVCFFLLFGFGRQGSSIYRRYLVVMSSDTRLEPSRLRPWITFV